MKVVEKISSNDGVSANRCRGFKAEKRTVLATDDILFPLHYDYDLEIKLVDSGIGFWFEAYLDGKLIGDLSLYFDGLTACLQSVGIHPDFRGRGVRETLVYEAGKIALDRFGATELVIEAEADSHAVSVYEFLGFRQTGRTVNHALFR